MQSRIPDSKISLSYSLECGKLLQYVPFVFIARQADGGGKEDMLEMIS